MSMTYNTNNTTTEYNHVNIGSTYTTGMLTGVLTTYTTAATTIPAGFWSSRQPILTQHFPLTIIDNEFTIDEEPDEQDWRDQLAG